jgi:hypothetical protein
MTVPMPIVTTQKANAIRQSNNSANQLIRNPPCTLYIALIAYRAKTAVVLTDKGRAVAAQVVGRLRGTRADKKTDQPIEPSRPGQD